MDLAGIIGPALLAATAVVMSAFISSRTAKRSAAIQEKTNEASTFESVIDGMHKEFQRLNDKVNALSAEVDKMRDELEVERNQAQRFRRIAREAVRYIRKLQAAFPGQPPRPPTTLIDILNDEEPKE